MDEQTKTALTNVLTAMNIIDDYKKCSGAFTETCTINKTSSSQGSTIQLESNVDSTGATKIIVYSLNFQDIKKYSYIHTDVCLLTDLYTLIIGFCNVNGTIPDKIGDLTNLTTLYFFQGNLSGTIPQSISKLTKLNGLSFDKNKLSGSVDVLNNFTTLSYLVISNNNFSGKLPSNIFNNPFSKYGINLNNNNFTGFVPIEIKNVSPDVNLSNNCLKITETVASSIKNKKNINLDNNNISVEFANKYGLQINTQNDFCNGSNKKNKICYNNKTGCYYIY